MALNEDLRFEDVDPQVRRAFLRAPEKCPISAGARLYKWTNRPWVGMTTITPWWSFVETTRLPSGSLAAGFRASETRAARLSETHREFAKARAAISDRFGNTMANLLVVRVNEPVWGFAGQASGQPAFAEDDIDRRNVVLIGGAWQIWIPNLTTRHLSLASLSA
jgi:hypothetical protein